MHNPLCNRKNYIRDFPSTFLPPFEYFTVKYNYGLAPWIKKGEENEAAFPRTLFGRYGY
jgi:hypothetical protein